MPFDAAEYHRRSMKPENCAFCFIMTLIFGAASAALVMVCGLDLLSWLVTAHHMLPEWLGDMLLTAVVLPIFGIVLWLTNYRC